MRSFATPNGNGGCHVLFGLTILIFFLASVVSISYRSELHGKKPTRWDTFDGPYRTPGFITGYSIADALKSEPAVCRRVEGLSLPPNGASIASFSRGLFVSASKGDDMFLTWNAKNAQITDIVQHDNGESDFNIVANCVMPDDISCVSVRVNEGFMRIAYYKDGVFIGDFDFKCHTDRNTVLKAICILDTDLQLFYITDGVLSAASLNVNTGFANWILDLDRYSNAASATISPPAYSDKTKSTRLAAFDGTETLTLFKLAPRNGNVLERIRVKIPNATIFDNAYRGVFGDGARIWEPKMRAIKTYNDEEEITVELYDNTIHFEETYEKDRFYHVFKDISNRGNLCGESFVHLAANPMSKNTKEGLCFGKKSGSLVATRPNAQEAAVATIPLNPSAETFLQRVGFYDRTLYTISGDTSCTLITANHDGTTTYLTVENNTCSRIGLDERFIFLLDDAEGHLCTLRP